MKTAIYVRVSTNEQTPRTSSPTSKPLRHEFDQALAAIAPTTSVETDPRSGVLPLWITAPSESSGTFVSPVSIKTLGSKKTRPSPSSNVGAGTSWTPSWTTG